MDQLAKFLQAVGYHAVLVQPLLPMYLHLIFSAIFPIYAGAHASLCRPPSAVKPPKRKKRDHDEDEPDEHKMEGMSPSDAILLPLFAGSTLAGLYYLIKWLEDSAILNKILNWYFSTFGVFSLARLITDIMGFATSMVFPHMYTLDNHTWTINSKERKATSSSSSSTRSRDSPLPGRLAKLPLPGVLKIALWTIRALPSQNLQIRLSIRNVIRANFKIGPQGCISFVIALAAQIYFNLVDKPWWLTNALGFSFAYNALQIISPTTSWTGTLILGTLFIYDIYFVFFTPMMVTVATKLDIPAKLLFPRPRGPGEESGRQYFSMLGLGDVVLPGMMIGFALRFDLYLFYLRKQTRREIEKPAKSDSNDNVNAGSVKGKAIEEITEKDKWYPASGGWGEKFWTSRKAIITSDRFHGTIFPKPYFHACLIGYVAGMIVTLGIMQIFGHAQPALLYLVPGVLGAFWGTAFLKGDVKTLWEFSEAEEEDDAKEDEGKRKKRDGDASAWGWRDWKSILFSTKSEGKPGTGPTSATNSHEDGKVDNSQTAGTDKKPSQTPASDSSSPKDGRKVSTFQRDRTSELVFFSINLPSRKPEETNEPEEPGKK